MFGNRLGNCAYDKTFLRDVKINGTAKVVNNLRPANYPRPQEIKENIMVPVNAVPTIQPINNTPEMIFDESIFDNSMMISEEELICSEETFIAVKDTDNKIYPLLPIKRK